MTDTSSKMLLKKAEAALEIAIEENQRVRMSYSQRMGELAHEIKNSLNSMMGFSEILKNEKLGVHSDPRYQEYAEFIHESTMHLLNICQRELAESKDQNLINAKMQPVQKIDVDVENIIDNTLASLRGLAEELGIDIKVEIDDDFPILKTDPTRLRQVLHNLVSNAIKFTPKGGHVCVKAKVDSDEGALILVIKDSGFGVPAEDVLKVMEPFEQVEDMESRGDAGSGLGLPIVKRLVEEMGAELQFRSRQNVGTMVSVIFPNA